MTLVFESRVVGGVLLLGKPSDNATIESFNGAICSPCP
jgi:hypothetical protein